VKSDEAAKLRFGSFILNSNTKMGFFKTVFDEFGKKTGKALGNKLYGAYADDERVGVNRGKLKGESDGMKITSEIRQSEIKIEKERAKLEREQIESKRKQAEYEREQIKDEKQRESLAEILNIELDPSNKEELIKTITTLLVYVDLWGKTNRSDEHLIAAKSKFDTGIALLQAADPNNPMISYFQQKKAEWKKEKKIGNIKLLILIIVCLVILIGVAVFADKL